MSPVSKKNVGLWCKKEKLAEGDQANGEFEYYDLIDPVTRMEGDGDDDDDDDGGYDYAPAA